MKILKVSIFLFMIVMILRCSHIESIQKPADQISAQDYYETGRAALNLGDWERAALSFSKAIKADPRYANGYAGMALVLMQQNQPEKALEYAQKAVQQDKKSIDAQVILGRVLLNNKPADWFKASMVAFDSALKINPQHEEALFYKANALCEHRDFESAKELFSNIAAQNGKFAQQAREQMNYITGYELVLPRTDIGVTMLRIDRITRGDLAALLGSEFDIVDVIHRRNPNYAGGTNQQFKDEEDRRIQTAHVISDITGHWAESLIRDVVQVGAMDIYPDNSFRPEELVQRMNFAMTLQNIIIQVTGNTALYTAFINTPSHYNDVKRTHYAYNAIQLVTEYEIMPSPPTSDLFDPNGTVSGFDALLTLRNLEDYLNTSF